MICHIVKGIINLDFEQNYAYAHMHVVSKLIARKMEIDFIAEPSNCLSPPKM